MEKRITTQSNDPTYPKNWHHFGKINIHYTWIERIVHAIPFFLGGVAFSSMCLLTGYIIYLWAFSPFGG